MWQLFKDNSLEIESRIVPARQLALLRGQLTSIHCNETDDICTPGLKANVRRSKTGPLLSRDNQAKQAIALRWPKH